MEIVLLGGTGFVGSAILRSLRATRVHALVRDPRRVPPVSADISLRLVPGDLQRLSRDLFPSRPHIVFHFATKQIDTDGTGFEEANVQGSRRIVESCNDATLAVIYGSSVSVYGQAGGCGVSENTPLRPATPLAQSRARAEEIILESAARRGIGAYCLRPRFIFGWGDRHTFPGLVRMVRSGVQPGSGEQCYSIIDVDDYARAVIALSARLSQPGVSEQMALHVAYARPLSLRDIVGLICRKFRLRSPRVRVPVRPWMAAFLRAIPTATAHTLATRVELFGFSHTYDVQRLTARIGAEIPKRHPITALEAAASHHESLFQRSLATGATCFS